MKGFVCLLFVPAAFAVWVLGSPQTAWRVISAFRRRKPGQGPPRGVSHTVLRVAATLALFSMIALVILMSGASD